MRARGSPEEPRLRSDPAVIERVLATFEELGVQSAGARVAERLAPLVGAINTCHLQAVRHASDDWERQPGAPPARVLEAALRPGLDAEDVLHIPDHAWAAAFPLWREGTARAFMVVTAPAPPAPSDVALLRVVALALRDVHARETDVGSADRLTARHHGVASSIQAVQRRLVAATTEGRGLDGIAAVVHGVTGLPAVVWDATGIIQGVAPHDDSSPAPPQLPKALPLEQPFREGQWMCWAARRDEEILATVGVLDREDADGDDVALVLVNAASTAALELYRLETLASAELRLWNDLASALLFGENPSQVAAQARALGYDVEPAQRVVLVEGDLPTERLAAAVRWALKGQAAGVLLTARREQVIAIVSTDVDWRMFAEALRVATGAHGCRIATSGWTASIDLLPLAVRHAEVALRLGQSLGSGPVTHYDDLGILRLIAANGDVEAMQGYVRHWLGPVMDYDRDRGSDLVHTLAEYLECGRSFERAANALSVHRSTLRYRLARVAELLDRDLSDPDVQFNAQLAHRVLRTLEALRA